VNNWMNEVSNDENGACFLQGTLFQDAELDWCMVSGWGVECGLPIVFYIPIGEINITNAEEHHCSMSEVMTMIRDSPPPPKYRGYKSSRAIKRAINDHKQCLFVRIMDKLPVKLLIGTMKPMENDRPRVMHRQKLLATKTIRKILKMQESLFKYGNSSQGMIWS
jgi:hypothetical protein